MRFAYVFAVTSILCVAPAVAQPRLTMDWEAMAERLVAFPFPLQRPSAIDLEIVVESQPERRWRVVGMERPAGVVDRDTASEICRRDVEQLADTGAEAVDPNPMVTP